MNYKPYDFINEVIEPFNDNELSNLWIKNGIIYERNIVYRDFVLSLIDLVCETYLGDDITNNEQKDKHFEWCWNKTIKSFKLSGFDFSNNDTLWFYFSSFFKRLFYNIDVKNDKLHFNLLKLWSYLFNLAKNKSKPDMDIYLKVYKLFDQPIKNM